MEYSRRKGDPLNAIRAKVISIFSYDGSILLAKGFDQVTEEYFYCPLGGGVDFGESSSAALVREIREEVQAEICNLKLLGVLENIFTFENQTGHEIVFVYDADFCDKSLYTTQKIHGTESDGSELVADWVDINKVDQIKIPIYPAGIIELIKQKI
jgi:ADP-ribose pyrophosphatase YjhB (NUDIX family)